MDMEDTDIVRSNDHNDLSRTYHQISRTEKLPLQGALLVAVAWHHVREEYVQPYVDSKKILLNDLRILFREDLPKALSYDLNRAEQVVRLLEERIVNQISQSVIGDFGRDLRIDSRQFATDSRLKYAEAKEAAIKFDRALRLAIRNFVDTQIRPEDWRILFTEDLPQAFANDLGRADKAVQLLEARIVERLSSSPVGQYWRDLQTDSRQLALDSQRKYADTKAAAYDFVIDAMLLTQIVQQAFVDAVRQAPTTIPQRFANARTEPWFTLPLESEPSEKSSYTAADDIPTIVDLAKAGRRWGKNSWQGITNSANEASLSSSIALHLLDETVRDTVAAGWRGTANASTAAVLSSRMAILLLNESARNTAEEISFGSRAGWFLLNEFARDTASNLANAGVEIGRTNWRRAANTAEEISFSGKVGRLFLREAVNAARTTPWLSISADDEANAFSDEQRQAVEQQRSIIVSEKLAQIWNALAFRVAISSPFRIAAAISDVVSSRHFPEKSATSKSPAPAAAPIKPGRGLFDRDPDPAPAVPHEVAVAHASVGDLPPDLELVEPKAVRSETGETLYFEYDFINSQLLKAHSDVTPAIIRKRQQIDTVDEMDALAERMAADPASGIFSYRLLEGKNPDDPDSFSCFTFVGELVSVEDVRIEALRKYAEITVAMIQAPNNREYLAQAERKLKLLEDLNRYSDSDVSLMVRHNIHGGQIFYSALTAKVPAFQLPSVFNPQTGAITYPFGEPDIAPQAKIYAELQSLDYKGEKRTRRIRVDSENKALELACKMADSGSPEIYSFQVRSTLNGHTSTGATTHFGQLFSVQHALSVAPKNLELADLSLRGFEYATRSVLRSNFVHFEPVKPGDYVRAENGEISMPLPAVAIGPESGSPQLPVVASADPMLSPPQPQ
jgi:hypothetical protein